LEGHVEIPGGLFEAVQMILGEPAIEGSGANLTLQTIQAFWTI